jgi:hypothetical protein
MTTFSHHLGLYQKTFTLGFEFYASFLFLSCIKIFIDYLFALGCGSLSGRGLFWGFRRSLSLGAFDLGCHVWITSAENFRERKTAFLFCLLPVFDTLSATLCIKFKILKALS